MISIDSVSVDLEIIFERNAAEIISVAFKEEIEIDKLTVVVI